MDAYFNPSSVWSPRSPPPGGQSRYCRILHLGFFPSPEFQCSSDSSSLFMIPFYDSAPLFKCGLYGSLSSFLLVMAVTGLRGRDISLGMLLTASDFSFGWLGVWGPSTGKASELLSFFFFPSFLSSSLSSPSLSLFLLLFLPHFFFFFNQAILRRTEIHLSLPLPPPLSSSSSVSQVLALEVCAAKSCFLQTPVHLSSCTHLGTQRSVLT